MTPAFEFEPRPRHFLFIAKLPQRVFVAPISTMGGTAYGWVWAFLLHSYFFITNFLMEDRKWGWQQSLLQRLSHNLRLWICFVSEDNKFISATSLIKGNYINSYMIYEKNTSRIWSASSCSAFLKQFMVSSLARAIWNPKTFGLNSSSLEF